MCEVRHFIHSNVIIHSAFWLEETRRRKKQVQVAHFLLSFLLMASINELLSPFFSQIVNLILVCFLLLF